MMGKRLGLLISSEETYPAAPSGIVHSIQEFSRYTRCEFVGVVQGIGNRRGDIENDPGTPLASAHRLGATLFSKHFSDYHLDTERPSSVFPDPALA